MKIKFKLFSKLFLLLSLVILFTSCSKVDARKTPQNAQERAKKNLEEGRGVSLKGVLGNRKGGGSFEFSTSNPMWRASLEILDFLPLTTVDYSGGIIITDWYDDGNNDNSSSIKITVRFLSNEIQTNSFKIIVHQRTCATVTRCSTKQIDSKIKEELVKSILTKATKIEKEQKLKK
jgi:hypothetical protein